MYDLKSTSKVFVHSEFHDSNTSPKIWMGPTKGWKTKLLKSSGGTCCIKLTGNSLATRLGIKIKSERRSFSEIKTGKGSSICKNL